MSEDFFRKSNKVKSVHSRHNNEMFYDRLREPAKFNFSVPIKSSYIFPALYMAALLGLPYHPDPIRKKTKGIPLWIKVWCICVCAIKVILHLTFLLTGALYIPYIVSIMTFYAKCIATILLTSHLVGRSKKITMFSRRMCEISHLISPNQKTGTRFCVLHIIFLVIGFSFSTFAFKKGVEAAPYNATHSIFGYDLLVAYKVSITTIFSNTIATVGISVIICTSIFATLKNIIVSFRDKMRDRYRKGYCQRKDIIEDIVMFRRIFNNYCQLEESLSPVLLLVNVLCIATVLNNLSLLLTRTLSLLSKITILISFVQAIAPLTYLIFSAANVTSEYDSLKQSLIRFSEDISTTTASDSDIALFTLLCDDIRSTNFYFSAGDMYIVDKGLILSMGGLIVTYGVIEYQLNTH